LTVEVTEGFVSFRGLRTWYRVMGDLGTENNGQLPLLLLHGGPGFPSDAFESLEALAKSGRPVVVYDQIGCGRSDRPRDRSLWTIETFLDELDTLRRELGLHEVHLFGWSWGGMLAIEYLLTEPDDVASVVLASTPVSIPLFSAEARRLREDLPEYVKRSMRRFEENYRQKTARPTTKVSRGMSTTSAGRMAVLLRLMFGMMARPSMARLAACASATPFLRRAAYEVAGLEWMRRHIIRRAPQKVPLSTYRTFAGVGREVYETMVGPSEFYVTGTLKDWDVSSRLGRVQLPALITSGRHDEVTPQQAEVLHHGIPGSQWVLFENSAHVAFVEEPDRYRAVLEEFLVKVESSAASDGGR
jgi:pimeloyl-ACP methyl ester carboxylesterase